MKRWKNGFAPKVDVKKVSAELRKIKEQRGRLAAPYVVEAARSKSSPLHSLFEWDDTKAAHQYRLVQARMIVRHVGVDTLLPDGTRVTLPEFYSILNDGEKIKDVREVYVTKEEVDKDRDIARDVVETARRELLNWKIRYENIAAVFSRMKKVFKAIDDL